MPYTDTLVRPNCSFGTTPSSGIYLYKVVSSESLLDGAISCYFLLTSGHLPMQTTLNQTFCLNLLIWNPDSSPYLPHLPKKVDGSS